MVSTFTSRGKAVFFVVFSTLLITVYVTKFSGNRVNYTDKLRDIVPSLKSLTLTNERSNSERIKILNWKMNTVTNHAKKFQRVLEINFFYHIKKRDRRKKKICIGTSGRFQCFGQSI
uniref:uncharacterized protein LOC120346904 n=1 Tax=Styela clava TaxID=7725 RepID=UPI00193ACA8E|nr:uncharacterized protein LOC120346904 [Styela clava]